MTFISPKSFVDSPFFSSLSKHKLDDAKLSNDPIPLKGLISVPKVPERPSALQLTYESFNALHTSASDIPLNFEISGSLLNLNTLEEFKDINKVELVHSQAAKLTKNSILSGAALEDPQLLSQFMVLTFADLKKYKFYYWFMFPTLKWTSKFVDISDDSSLPQVDELMSKSTQPIVELRQTESGKWEKLKQLELNSDNLVFGICDFSSLQKADQYPSYLKNFAALLSYNHVSKARLYIYRPNGGSKWVLLEVGNLSGDELNAGAGAEGWERNAQNKLMPKFTDLSSLMDPLQLASEAVDLNLKLMKWRAAPEIDLESIAHAKCLLLGAGTLGSYISRGLMAWGVKHITFVDNGTVSYSNPVRQPLYTHTDCIDHAPKAETAAKALKEIFPGVTSSGYSLEIPMVGHTVTNKERQKREHDKLTELIDQHDVVFLLMDSRESRWLPTVISAALQKTVINVALGFDSYLVMRHGLNRNLGCYFCHDIVAPKDSISRQTLDQMCTVTRPGCAMIASGCAVELLARIYQHKERAGAEMNAPTILGPIMHQLRGFLASQETMKVGGPAFASCTGCGPAVDLWKEARWEFVEKVLSIPEYLSEISGIAELQRQTEELDIDVGLDSEEEGLE